MRTHGLPTGYKQVTCTNAQVDSKPDSPVVFTTICKTRVKFHSKIPKPNAMFGTAD